MTPSAELIHADTMARDAAIKLVGIVVLADLARRGVERADLAAGALVNVTEPTPHAPRV